LSIQRFGSGGRWEEQVGYSRAVRAGGLVFVAGCTGVDGSGQVVPGGTYEQARQACANVLRALDLAGARADQVVQTRMYVLDIEQWEEVGRAHAEAFGAHPPAAAMVQVSRFIAPAMVVEVEAVAFVG
jgi:enamine deaminase RidA (YjgF/YER057c/UK114 family)